MISQRSVVINRRSVIRGLLSAGAFGVTSQLWTGCTAEKEAATTAAQPITVGFIYVGPKEDYGYNQAHAESAAKMVKNAPWIKLVEEASVPETTAVEETMRSMIEQDGAKVIFPTSWGYFDPHSLKLAKEFPDVQFFHPNHPLEDSYPKNVGSYFSALLEPAYLSGIVAAQMSKTGKLGFVMPKPIPIVLQELNSFALGAQSIKPDIIVQTIVTGDWSLPIKEAEATNSLIDQGVDVVISRVDNQKVVIQTAEKRGVFSCGYHLNQAIVAPKGYLTGVEWNWEKIYSVYAESFKAGKTLVNGNIPRVLQGSLKDGFSKISPYGSAVTAAAKTAVEQAKAQLIAGSLTIFEGELRDNKGNIVIPSSEKYALGDSRLNSIDWLVKGIEGDTGKV
jgi:simple sugar transport system substrate-binding protein